MSAGQVAGSSGRPSGSGRTVTLELAPTDMEPVQWLWEERLPLGVLSLLAGREGIGKSTVAYTLGAAVTRGTLPGCYHGIPRTVVVCATEDSWKHTITPRLVGAGADMSRVRRVNVKMAQGGSGSLNLPDDIGGLEQALAGTDVALLILDPLISRLDGALDTHKDAEVRKALEPLVAMIERRGVTILGLIHVNKGRTDDPLQSVMGSRAFTAVSRSVQYVISDPANEAVRLFGTPKNNLGRSDLPSLCFRIERQKVADHPKGPVTTGVLRWEGEDARTIRDALSDSQDSAEVRTAAGEAADWLTGYLSDNGGTAPSADIRRDGDAGGHSYDSLKRARRRLGLEITNTSTVPRTTFWSLPDTQLPAGGDQ